MHPRYKRRRVSGYNQVFKEGLRNTPSSRCATRSSSPTRRPTLPGNLNSAAGGRLTVNDNNSLVWLGTVINDQTVLINGWHTWFTDHDQFEKLKNGPDMNNDVPPLPRKRHEKQCGSHDHDVQGQPVA